MQNTEPTTNIPASLQPKIAEYMQQSSRKVDNICRRNKVSKATADALIFDMQQLMQAKFRGYIATPMQMREIAERTTRMAWERTENPALAIIACSYFDITEILAGQQRIGGLEWVHAMQACGAAAAMGEEIQQRWWADAKRYAYLYCLFTAGEWCNATAEELAQIEPYSNEILIPAKMRTGAVETALDMQRQRKEILERRQVARSHGVGTMNRNIATAVAHGERRAAPSTINDNTTIRQYQNVAYMLSKDLQTADITNDGQQEGTLRPLWQAIEDKRKAAQELINDRRLHATPQDIEKAQNLIATTTAVYHVLRGIQVLPQVMLPESGNTMQQEYRTTPRQFTIYATGSNNPSQTQIDNCMRALDFISTQRMEIGEEVIKSVPQYDKDGNPMKDAKGRVIKKRKAVPTITRFSPCTTTFYGEYNEKTQAIKAKEIVLSEHNIIVYGKSASHKSIVEADGKAHTYAIAEPQAHRLPLWQVYEFASDEEQRFEYALVSKGKRNEDDLLKEVFAYAEKQAKAKANEDAALKALQSVATSTTATEEERKAAQVEYLRAKEKTADCITKHKGRDKERLQAMFQKAQDKGIIKYWYKEPQAGSTGKRTTYNYVWGRFTDEELKKHRQKRGTTN